MRSETCCFRVSGDFVTDHARALVEEGDWREAVNFLENNLVGIEHSHVVDILSAKKRLTGVNNMELADESKAVRKKWNGRMAWMYGGVVRERRQRVLYWRPYAQVTSWSAEDLPSPDMENKWHRIGASKSVPTDLPHNKGALGQWGLARCVYYMDDRANDRAIINRESVAVLWQQVDAPPLWWTVCREFQDGLEQWLRVFKKLPERGGANLPGKSDRVSMLASVGMQIRCAKIDSKLPIPEVPEEPNNPTDRLIAALSNPTSEEEPVIVGKPTADFGLIAPDGKFYPCRYYEHKILCLRVLKQLHDADNGSAYTEEKAEHLCDELGYIRVTVSQITGEPEMFHYGKQRLPNAQVKTAIEWCLAHEVQPSRFDFLGVKE